jgi:hypothetical protein
MKIVATKSTAALAGLWSGAGALCFEAWVQYSGAAGRGSQPVIFIVGLLPFFFIPTFMFVLGSSERGALIERIFQASGRGVCWIAGAAAVLIPGLPLVSRIYAS